MKNSQTKTFSVLEETLKIFSAYESAKPLQIVTMIYLQPPSSKKLLSEDIPKKPMPADATISQRQKFFEQGDVIVTGRFLSSEQLPAQHNNQDLMVFEVLTTKLTLSQASKLILPPLIAISSKLYVDLGDEDLLAAIDSSVKLLQPLLTAFNYETMKTYPEEECVDVVSHEVVPLGIKFMSSDARVEKAIS